MQKSFQRDRLTPEIQKVSYINCNFSAGVLQLAPPVENGKNGLVIRKKRLRSSFPSQSRYKDNVKDPVVYDSKGKMHDKSSGTFKKCRLGLPQQSSR